MVHYFANFSIYVWAIIMVHGFYTHLFTDQVYLLKAWYMSNIWWFIITFICCFGILLCSDYEEAHKCEKY
jgi:hypothetical protein